MSNIINTVVFLEGGTSLADNPAARPISCDGTEIVGLEWLVPVINNGILDGYERKIQTAKPTLDAVHTIRLQRAGHPDIWILINDGDGLEVWVDKCNTCCGVTLTMDAVVVPDPIIEQTMCPATVGGTVQRTWNFPLPVQNGFNLTGTASFGGVPDSTPLTAGGYTTPALFLTAIQTAWAGSGRTWSLQNTNTVLRLVATVDTSVGVHVSLVEKINCYDILANDGDIINEIVIGGQVVPITQLTVDATNGQALQLALASYLPGIVYTEDAGDSDHPYLQYTGFLVPTNVRNTGAVTGAFSVGACF